MADIQPVIRRITVVTIDLAGTTHSAWSKYISITLEPFGSN
jgi:hypothetical protein